MFSRLFFRIFAILAMVLISEAALSQPAEPCRDGYVRTERFINQEAMRWTGSIQNAAFLPEVRGVFLVIVKFSHDGAVNGAAAKLVECRARYAVVTEIMDLAVQIFSQGLRSIAPGRTAYVEVSEIVNGYPLGGPPVLIKLIEHDLSGRDRGDIGNTIMNPYRCLLWGGC
jgi:hypothetical protein